MAKDKIVFRQSMIGEEVYDVTLYLYGGVTPGINIVCGEQELDVSLDDVEELYSLVYEARENGRKARS